MPGGSGMPAVTADIFSCDTERGRDEVFKHVLVVAHQSRVDRHAAHVVLAGHRHLDHAGAGLPFDLGGRQLVLHTFHVFLHLLRLLHQAGELTLHHLAGPVSLVSRGLIEAGSTDAPKCSINSRTKGSP
jgi:hypothetical protein